MDMSGERRIPAPREKVWQGLNDADVLRASIPGCESLEKISDTEFKATAAIKIGPIAARFNGRVALTDIDPPNGYRIGGEGQGGVAGFAKGGATVSLVEEGAETLLNYVVQAQVGGKIAQLGARLIDATAKQMAEQFFTRFANQVSEGAATGLGGLPASETAPTATPVMAGEDPAAPAQIPPETPEPGTTPPQQLPPELATGASAKPTAGTAPTSLGSSGVPLAGMGASPPIMMGDVPSARTAPASVSTATPAGAGVVPTEPPIHVAPAARPAPAAISIFSLIPNEIAGYPLIAWIGTVLYLLILLLLFGSLL